ncbi:MAG: cbb3-type cytochrome c oxidase subunit I [Syntrophobacteraceae bacterium]
MALGYSQGREYAEWIWPVDIALLIALVLMAANLTRAAITRKEPTLYVSVWYILATMVFIFGTYFFGNAVWDPSTGAITGLADAQLAWFYGHSLVGLFLTPLAVAAAVAYYVIPIVVRAPLYSHTLSLIGFWSILVIYNTLGAHHILQTPIPTWLKMLAITDSIAMFVPVYIVLFNLWLTARGRLGYIHANMGGKFVMAGLVWYLLVCTQGPLQALPIVQRVTHLNNWTVGHSHLGVLGFAGTIALGGMWFIIPRITGRPIYSTVLADIQYWLVLLGMAGFLAVLTIAGLIQGNSWRNAEAVQKALPQIHVYMILRAGIGVLIVGGAYIGLYNVVRSFWPVKYTAREIREAESGALP